ncbi:hypothetical protein AVEN_207168-1, partial [Araneus ventricosus]
PEGIPNMPSIPSAPTMDQVPGADQMKPDNIPGMDKISDVPGIKEATDAMDKAKDMSDPDKMTNISQYTDMAKSVPAVPAA